MKGAAGLAYRDSGVEGAPAVLLLHGYPESSYMWREVLPALAQAGRRGLAPDLPGFGDSDPDPPGTWERHMEAVDRFATARMAERFHEEIPDSELQVFEDAGHFVWEDEPERSAAVLVDFLDRRVPRA